jgi:hypothetical protein
LASPSQWYCGEVKVTNIIECRWYKRHELASVGVRHQQLQIAHVRYWHKAGNPTAPGAAE